MKPFAYKAFMVGDLFQLSSPERRFNANSVTIYDSQIEGSFRYVVRTSENNGIRGYIKADMRYLSPANTFSFGQDTATVFFQDKPYFTGDKIKVMRFLPCEPTEQVALYLLTVIRVAFSGFTWGQSSFNQSTLENMKIVMPVTEDDSIDFGFIESYTAELQVERATELEAEQIAELEAYLTVTGLSDYVLTEVEEFALTRMKTRSGQWGDFQVGILFEKLPVGFIGGKRKIGSAKKEQSSEYCIPLTCAKIGDNGIMYWGKRGDFITYTNTISIIADGAVSAGLVYAQPEEAGAYSHSYFIRYNEKEVSPLVNLYFASVLNKTIYPKYSRERAPRWEGKVANEIISLPLTSTGGLDFEFMENYILAQEKLSIQDVVKMKEQVLAETKKIIGHG